EVVEDRRVGENSVERLGALAPGLFREADRERAKRVETLDLFAQLRVLGLGREHVAVVRRPAALARTGLAGHGHGRPPPRSGSPEPAAERMPGADPLFPLVVRLPLLHEGRDALARVLAPKEPDERLALELQPFVETHSVSLDGRELDLADRVRRAGRVGTGALECPVQRHARGEALVDDA